MCMQDLIISRAVSVRPLVGITTSGTGGSVIPPNPNRVWIAVHDGNSSGGVGLYTDEQGLTPPLNGVLDSSGTPLYFRTTLSVTALPGAFSSALYSTTGPSVLQATEGVLDPALADAVSAGYTRLLHGME